MIDLRHGDCLDILATLPDASVDAVVTDPPYGLEFMGKEWDKFGPGTIEPKPVPFPERREGRGDQGSTSSTRYNEKPRWSSKASGERAAKEVAAHGRNFQTWCELWTAECLRVLKPGGHLLAFGGTRTWHRLACAVEDAGFEVRDSIAWLYGSGFSKSWNFKTMYPGPWCECPNGANALPYNHADNAEMPRVRDDVHPSPVARGEGQDAVLLTPMQRSGEGPRVGEARPQGAGSLVAGDGGPSGRVDARREELGMEGRDLHRAGQGLSDGEDARPPASASERLCSGAPARDGDTDRAARDASRGGASHQRGPGGQSAGEPEALPGSHEPLDDGALRDGAVCSRCGGLDPFYRGAGTGLKPAFEPVVVARKPLSGTVAANVLAHGTGALNIDGCRIDTNGETWSGNEANAHEDYSGKVYGTFGKQYAKPSNPAGRWPANVVLDESQAAALDEQSGELPSQKSRTEPDKGTDATDSHIGTLNATRGGEYLGQQGGASRFFYVAKADASERVRVPRKVLRLRSDLTPEQVDHVTARLREAGVPGV